jgi:hypothetical protein
VPRPLCGAEHSRTLPLSATRWRAQATQPDPCTQKLCPEGSKRRGQTERWEWLRTPHSTHPQHGTTQYPGHNTLEDSTHHTLHTAQYMPHTLQHITTHTAAHTPQHSTTQHPGHNTLQDSTHARCWWLTPVILATQEAEIRRITVGS